MLWGMITGDGETVGRAVFPLEEGCRPEWRRGVWDAVPVMVGFVPFALVLGVQATQKGLAPWEVMLLTGMNFGGGSEFAAIGLWTSPPSILLLAMITLLVNSRHLIMGAVFSRHMKHVPWRKALPALFFMCDESWALGVADTAKGQAAGRTPALSYSYYLGSAVGLYLTWVVFTTLGALVGPALGDITEWGFGMAFPAVFLVLLRGMWKGARAARPWLVSLAAAVATYLVVPGAWYVPAGALAGIAAAWWWAKDLEGEEEVRDAS